MKTGDKILVWAGPEAKSVERTYLCKWKGRFLCVEYGSENEEFPETTAWKFAEEIPKPTCRPYDMKEFTAERGMPTIATGIVVGIGEECIRINVGHGIANYRYKENLIHMEWPNGDKMGVEVTDE